MDDLETIFAALADGRRRLALSHLQKHHTVPLPDLAELIAEHEQRADVQDIPGEQVKDVYMSLYHKHVPVLEEANLAHYEQEQDLVRRTESTSTALESAREELERLQTAETA